MVIHNTVVEEAFERFKKTNTVINESDLIIDESRKYLFKKLIKNRQLYKFREECKKEASIRTNQQRRRDRIFSEQVPQLLFKLECVYDLANFLHLRLLSKINSGCSPEEVEAYLKDAGRTIGAKLYDLPTIQSGLYSLDALRNIKKYKKFQDSITQNTNEHFFSLYANGGPLIIRKAMIKTLEKPEQSFNIEEFVRIVSYLNQTIKTTRTENSRLQKYHSFNAMIDVQESYTGANISQLVNCGHDYESDIHIKWMFACKHHGFDLKIEAGRHFTDILEIDQMLIKYPELKNVHKFLPKTLKPYRG